MTVVVDGSQLFHWRGRLTGVPRVEYELAKRFKNDKDVNFVDWTGGVFSSISLDDGLAQRNTNTSSPTEITRTDKAKRKLKRYANHVPYLAEVYKNVKAKQSGRVHEPEISTSMYDFKEHDIFFIGQGLWHDQGYIDYLMNLNSKGVKIVQIVYDMLPIVAPQFSGHSSDWLQNYATQIYPVCSQILTISKHTTKDLTRWLKENNLHTPKINDFALGEDYEVISPKKPSIISYQNNFMLSVGTIEVRKNHMIFYYLYKLAKSRNLALPPLVIVGRRGWETENIYNLLTTDPDIKSQVTILENTSDEELAWLYRNCRFTVYPSFYEGWGLPIAESLYNGAPCISSNSSSMTEVAPQQTIYFNPASPDELLNKVTGLMDDSLLAKARKIASTYKPRSWDKSHEEIMNLIEELYE